MVFPSERYAAQGPRLVLESVSRRLVLVSRSRVASERKREKLKGRAKFLICDGPYKRSTRPGDVSSCFRTTAVGRAMNTDDPWTNDRFPRVITVGPQSYDSTMERYLESFMKKHKSGPPGPLSGEPWTVSDSLHQNLFPRVFQPTAECSGGVETGWVETAISAVVKSSLAHNLALCRRGDISIRRIPGFTGRDIWRTVISRESTCIDIIRASGTPSGFEDPEGACPRVVEVGSGRRSGQSWYYER
ncbi:hypothetical protein EAG_06836 [Camponotus floridanus]|uniref:Uncharacterized protein n=1 Tax=Camponotus floridanus TaxID=104421 RepID=E2A1H9_CAMFO|nr:hypothetical protein EAG_06836 [Camponotus floridanus]